MISEQRQDQAIDYVLGQMSGPEAAAFEAELREDPKLREFVAGMNTAAASIVFSAQAVAPPRELFTRILTELNPRPPRHGRTEETSFAWASLVPWALAACLALACTLLALNQTRLQREITEVRNHNALAQVTIATLTSQAAAYSKVGAVVVWNVQDQHGVVELNRLPPLDTEHDYQLWVIDPTVGHPVSAGVVTVSPDGSARVVFQPVLRVENVAQFALSIERKGGGPVPLGKIVMAGR